MHACNICISVYISWAPTVVSLLFGAILTKWLMGQGCRISRNGNTLIASDVSLGSATWISICNRNRRMEDATTSSSAAAANVSAPFYEELAIKLVSQPISSSLTNVPPTLPSAATSPFETYLCNTTSNTANTTKHCSYHFSTFFLHGFSLAP